MEFNGVVTKNLKKSIKRRSQLQGKQHSQCELENSEKILNDRILHRHEIRQNSKNLSTPLQSQS